MKLKSLYQTAVMFVFSISTAYAIDLKKPQLLEGATADTSKQDNIIKLIVETVLSWSLYGALLGLVISLFLMLPFIGHKDMGMKGAKASGWVFAIAVLFDTVILPFLAKFW